MHTLTSSFVLGFHGCDVAVAEQVLAGDSFVPIRNDYDWLGHGIYFWEANPDRALSFAQEATSRRGAARITQPTAVGVIIDMGLCLDLTTSAGVAEVRIAYESYMKVVVASALSKPPTNSRDKLRRSLDCAVINMLHSIREGVGAEQIDTVKGVFTEGAPIYPEAGILEKTHIQICVRNQRCIKGVFRLRETKAVPWLR